jgi:hypothetical protein
VVTMKSYSSWHVAPWLSSGLSVYENLSMTLRGWTREAGSDKKVETRKEELAIKVEQSGQKW